MFTGLIESLTRAGNAMLGTLPLCPFYRVQEITLSNELLSWLSWFIPFDAIIALLNAWLAAIAVWYIAKKALRWAKIIS
jgi:hypothetical protein